MKTNQPDSKWRITSEEPPPEYSFLTDALDDGEIELIKDEWQRLNEPLASIVDYQADVLEPMIEELKENQ